MRIRTIKPEFWSNEGVAACSTPARLMFIGLWGMADDFGVGKANPLLVKAAIFPLDNLKTEQISAWLDELEANDRIRRYEIEGRRYFCIPSWEKHQAAAYRRGDRQHPAPPPYVLEHPLHDSARAVVQDSAGREGKGREQGTGKGKEIAALTPQQQMFGEVCAGMGYDENLSDDDAKEVGGVAKALLSKKLEPAEFASYLAWLSGPESTIVNGTRITLHSLPKWVKDWRAKPRVVSKPSGAASAPGRTLAQAEELRRAGL